MSATIRIEAKKGDLGGLSADIAIVCRFKGDPVLPGPVDRGLAQRLVEIAKVDRFEGRAGALRDAHHGCSRMSVKCVEPRLIATTSRAVAAPA